MKHIKPFCIILLFSLAGEICSTLLPFAVPASICGMVLLLLALGLKLVKLETVKEAGSFLVSLLPLLFVAPTVGLLSCWDLIRNDIAAIAVIVLVTTFLTFAVSGLLTKWLGKGGDSGD